MTPSSHQGLVTAYLSALTLTDGGDIVEVDEEQWAVAEHLRLTLGAEVPDEVCGLIGHSGHSAWTYKGIGELLGGNVNRLVACDLAELALSAYEERFPGDDILRRTVGDIRSFAKGEGGHIILYNAANRARGVAKESESAGGLAGMAATIVARLASPFSPGALYDVATTLRPFVGDSHEIELITRYIRAGGAL